VDVLCADKTGTITKNELTLADVQPLEGFTPQTFCFLAA
jgi:magnesium-transporting ATPase (P-type)